VLALFSNIDFNASTLYLGASVTNLFPASSLAVFLVTTTDYDFSKPLGAFLLCDSGFVGRPEALGGTPLLAPSPIVLLLPTSFYWFF
jgi:hypothetical protein